MYQFISRKTQKSNNWVTFHTNLRLGLHEKQVNNYPFESEDSDSLERTYLYYDPLDSLSSDSFDSDSDPYTFDSQNSDDSDFIPRTMSVMPASNYYFNARGMEVDEHDVFVNDEDVEESYRPTDCAHIKREIVNFRNREITAIFKVRNTNQHYCGKNFFHCEECLMACRIFVKTPLHPTVKMFQSLHTWHYCSMFEAYFKYVVKIIARTDEIQYSDHRKEHKSISDLLNEFYL